MSEPGSPHDGRAELSAALSAARRVFDGESPSAHDTESRILVSVRKKRRMPRGLWAIPLAAAFGISAAFAHELAGRLADVKKSLFADASPATNGAPSEAMKSPGAVASSVDSAPASGPPAPEATGRREASEAVSPELVAVARSAPAASASVAQSAVRSPTPVTEPADELALYKEAHRAHFDDHDYASALAGWDRYLAQAPRGTFALEARYNRAVALHRLGRRAEAIEALRPFAAGTYGRYRRDEAQELIDELR
ncbi:MAG TPA: hypothetical protein VFZ53_10730 [Polyangiaceae bacterium]